MNKKVLLISNTDGAMYKFRKSLLRTLREHGVLTIGVTSPTSPEGSYSTKLMDIFHRLYLVDFFRQGLISFLRTPPKIMQICKHEKPNVIHIYGHEALIYATLAIYFASIPHIVITITGLGRFFSRNSSFFRRFVKLMIVLYYYFILKSIDRVIFLNSNDLILFEEMFPSHKRNFVLINGEGSEFQALDNFTPKPNNGCYHFTFASRLMIEKGIIELLQAFEELPSCYTLDVLGSIDESLENHPLIISMINGKLKNVKYFGFVDDINSFLIDGDCVILPSKYMEGLPIILVEALAKGKFIVTSDAPGCSDTIIDGINGILLKEISVKSIVKAVMKVADVNLEKAHYVSVNLFRKKFNAETVVGKILLEYNTDLNKIINL
jgi:N,N'-diacetylbacillosaminyl-diphospho-undecaprenol alpha-1,3-N-acetylgalactosaminyltransferase